MKDEMDIDYVKEESIRSAGRRAQTGNDGVAAVIKEQIPDALDGDNITLKPVEVVALEKPMKLDGKEISEIRLDFSLLNGRVRRMAEKRYYAQGGMPMSGGLVLSEDYCIICAAAISGLPYEFFDELSGPKYTEVATDIRAFLFGMPVEEPTTTESAASA